MAVLQPILDIAELCFLHGIRHVVISPGSRSAALTLAFARHGGFKMHVAIDERSGGFIGLGIAQETRIPVVLICTSGSAVYNLAPAIAEAYFQQVPLIVLTADRPPEWIHQYDGQTIYQSGIFGRHVKKFSDLPADYQHKDSVWAINRLINEAIHIASTEPSGPVHVNVPIREPFYPTPGEILKPSEKVRKITKARHSSVLSSETWHELLDEWDSARRILIAVGQSRNEPESWRSLYKISEELDIPVVADCISNLPGNVNIIRHHDLFLSHEKTENLRPDLLITTGLSFISKELKQFLRRNPAVMHWHIGEETLLADPLQSLTRIIPVSAAYFFDNLFEKIDYQLFVENSEPDNDSAYLTSWLHHEYLAGQGQETYTAKLSTLNDFSMIDSFIKLINGSYQLQIGNSMPIRYVNALGENLENVTVRCNRGTSGIDGCLSTAIGAALVSEIPVYLLIGDVSFLYDRNGLLVKPLPDNLKIIVLNNDGGNIFRMIEGPSGVPELETFFETKHGMNAKRTAEDAGIAYFSIKEFSEMSQVLNIFNNTSSTALLEVFSDPAENKRVWKGLKAFVSEKL
ncbi:2-succinyl-5-enolpyruvyl-6-hydroxy-3-cyclohexene-1-carboxylate synthase [Dyadobacter sp. CECT 9275]|uniref:2-succinyl-5-enolpyruvyl-6-hydroxy-3-cyclohexene-1-carboxylate synthase n=1 Tax=Dyadobacter helix TaxID=2822344 RepID=A0A916N5C2_9BACT|nr:2-succinyl-5-enolpyruvyl-6-hydroxy-3-cyclohexene-1-carboxylic-acid synthase [Dyadobacter sp. CECT 9275]CAG4997623.1 2-succinyl-5-enolpyruvyl-6-hydroxy-3-cyclohexene-1-carboxylate synthase [Dyadobacter sp. CECT 9275]